jgi:hypothetical protein
MNILFVFWDTTFIIVVLLWDFVVMCQTDIIRGGGGRRRRGIGGRGVRTARQEEEELDGRSPIM